MKKELKHIEKHKISIYILIIVLFLSLAHLITSCEKGPEEPDEDVVFDVFPTEFLGIIENKDIYITSIGQAIDIEDFLIEIDYLDLFTYTHDNLLQADEVPDGAVVMAIVGCSIKGLNSANTTLDAELARSLAFMEATSNKRITFIAWHIGGMARRGSTSDQIIETIFSGASLDVFWTYGNSDKFLTNIVLEHEVPCYQIDYIGNIGLVLKLLAGDTSNAK